MSPKFFVHLCPVHWEVRDKHQAASEEATVEEIQDSDELDLDAEEVVVFGVHQHFADLLVDAERSEHLFVLVGLVGKELFFD